LNYSIPFNRPALIGKEIEYIQSALQAGHISGDGYFTKKCCELLEKELEVGKVLLTTSCTHALEMAALLLNIKPGDEVIVPSFTFVSTANAFVLRGARPVFVDIRSDTLNLDEMQIERLITKKTKAIVPVHYAGVGCEMEQIIEIAGRYRIPVVEDNAHGLFGKYKGQYLGKFGSFATQSFHETKNISCGEGGALLINEPAFIERAEIIREKGTNRNRFFRGQVDKYTWVDQGSSYLPSDLLAAFLYAQLESRERIQAKRRLIWEYYYQNLEVWALENDIILPTVPSYCDQSFHMFYLIMPTLSKRDSLIKYLKENGILSVFHYVPLHLSEMGLKYKHDQNSCPVTEDISQRLLRLPFYFDLCLDQIDCVIRTMKDFSIKKTSI
jgi:dTDP-4-amino-4,6-dideoxygalactose transaminase